MKTLKFKCTLLGDLVLNASAATEGEQTSLDYIPGNCFLGIVASEYDSFSKEEQMTLFHSGKVRFGDAHIANNDSRIRSLHVPATLFFPKMKSPSEVCYAWQDYSREEDRKINHVPTQLKQCRTGYYEFEAETARFLGVSKHFTIKSAYDRVRRRTSDSQMFGYESIDKNQIFLFEVETDDDSLTDKIEKLLTGRHRIGRSRTAQYGSVLIEKAEFKDYPSLPGTLPTKNGPRVAVYADSRLVFLDGGGQPVFCPTAKQLGLDGEIDWELSQIRTFQYAPWNGKRQSRDNDRCGIEKGSVFFVKTTSPIPPTNYVGNYNNEGFGRVIYNPAFLLSKGDNGIARIRLGADDINRTSHTAPSSAILNGTPLLAYLAAKKAEHEADLDIMDAVNDFVHNNKGLFSGASFASQWGTIRKIAMGHLTKEEIVNELFDKEVQRRHEPTPGNPTREDKKVPAAYLTHGVAAEKWKKRGRKDKLREFIDSIAQEQLVRQAVVNLASEMAKICSTNGKD